MAKKIIEHFPPHRIYVEPFCGSCSVLMTKEKSFVEVINDSDEVIVNIFKSLRDHPLELLAKIWATPYAKANFKKLDECLIEQSVMAIAQAKQFYIGNQNTSTFSIDTTSRPHGPKPNVWSAWHERVLPACARLKTVQILNEDALATIKRFYQNPEALIYIDPPYVGHEKEYKKTVDYDALIEIIAEAKCHIVISEFEKGNSFWPNEYKRIVIKTVGRSGSGAHKKTKINNEFLIIKDAI